VNNPQDKGGSSRRQFLMQLSYASAGIALAPLIPAAANAGMAKPFTTRPLGLSLQVNGKKHQLDIDPRTTLLDLLREQLSLTGTKKGCDRGQCGACTVLVNNRRVNACLTLAATCQQASVTTIEGLAKGDQLHPVQEAFIKHDAFQCGYCTPGQICSAVGLLQEGHARTEAEIREAMSGNICRCGAYRNITDAISEVKNSSR